MFQYNNETVLNKPFPYYSSAIKSDAYDFSYFYSHVVVFYAVFNGEGVRCVCGGVGSYSCIVQAIIVVLRPL